MSAATPSNGKPLRFAALIRVSTEKQEQQGESLRTQRAQNEQNAALLGGSVVAWYGGQEHATEGWERKELARLAADAAKGKFDAVILAHADRWDRGGEEARQAREALKRHGVRFFIGVSEYNLHNPEHVLFLDLSSAIGKFQASNQNKKSLLNRIARARRGLPTAGRALPFGRTWDKKTAQWGIDPAKEAMIADVAERYLAGESLVQLAKEYRIDHSYLCTVLRERCGESWTLDFEAADLNIRETVTLAVPRLLPEKTIRAVRERLKANRTYLHKPPRSVHDYLLGGRIFCEACGCLLTGQVATNSGGRVFRYYRHAHNEPGLKCPVRPRPWVRADKIEAEVVRQLFKMFGNPAEIARSIEAAAPDCQAERKRQARLEADLVKVEKARARILGLVVKDALTERQAEKELRRLTEQEQALQEELDRLAEALANVPDVAAVQLYVLQVQNVIFVWDDTDQPRLGGNDEETFASMSRADKRRLIEAVFGGLGIDGNPTRPGVYVRPEGEARRGRPRRWAFTIKGRLNFELVMRQAERSPSPCRS